MSDWQDPPRMFDEPAVPAELRELLSAAHADGISADAVERIAAETSARIVGPQGGGTPSGSAAPGPGSLGSMTAGKVAIGAAALVIAVGGIWLASSSGGKSVAEQSPVTAVSPAPPAVPQPLAAVEGSAAPIASQSPSAAPAPAESVSAPAAIPRVGAGTAAAASSGRAPATADSAGLASLMEEHRILRSARQALESDLQRALALTQEHARRFPGGTLAQEREVIAIDALARLGRAKDAKDRAKGFREQYPDSPHRDQVESTSKSTSPGPMRP